MTDPDAAPHAELEPDPGPDIDIDIAVLTGHLSRDPMRTDLASGSVLHRYEITARHDSGTVTVPVVWFDPARPPALRSGDGVVVVGHVRRRFFRAGGSTRSATEVVAASVARSGRNQRALRALERAVSALSGRRD